MAFVIFFFFLKKFQKVEKTGIISTKFSLRCTPSVILGLKFKFSKILLGDKNATYLCSEIISTLSRKNHLGEPKEEFKKKGF